MMSRKLILSVSLLLALTISLSGTLAYLTNTDYDHNTMTLGSVKIDQIEHQRADADNNGSYDITDDDDGDKYYLLDDFVQEKPLLPIVGNPEKDDITKVGSYGGVEMYKNKNIQDKFVTVANIGNADAYVRTYVAIEIGSVTDDKDKELVRIIAQAGEGKPWTSTEIGVCSIKDNCYRVYEYVYVGTENHHKDGILPDDETTYPNLSQVYLTGDVNNEHMTALDGNQNNKLDILVLSQAVQADGFTTAAQALTTGFGDAKDINTVTENMNIVDWLSGVIEADSPVEP